MSKKVLNLAAIAALVPEGEEFVAEAMNEGIWLTEAHVTAIDAQLAANTAAITKAGEDATAAAAAQKLAEDNLTAANGKINKLNARIVELDAENKELSGKPAEQITQTGKTEDTPPSDPAEAKKSKYHTSFDDQAAAYAKK